MPGTVFSIGIRVWDTRAWNFLDSNERVLESFCREPFVEADDVGGSSEHPRPLNAIGPAGGEQSPKRPSVSLPLAAMSLFNFARLHNKIVLITGASAGIGKVGRSSSTVSLVD